MYPVSSPLFPSPSAFPLDALSNNFLSFLLVPSHRGRGGALLRPVAFSFPVPIPSVRALISPPFPRPRCLFPFHFPSLIPLASPVSFAARPIRSGARRWRTAPDTDRTHSCGRQDNWYLHSQQALTTRQASCAGAVVFAAGAVPSYFPSSDPSILTGTGAGFCSPSSSVTYPIARGVVADVMTVQNGA